MSKIKKTLFKFISELPVIGKILSDNNLRLRTSLYFGTLVNLLYVVLKVTSGILYRSLFKISVRRYGVKEIEYG